MANKYIFDGKTFFVARAPSGYVTRAHMAGRTGEEAAEAAADHEAAELERFVQQQQPVPPSMLASLAQGAFVPPGCRVLRVELGRDAEAFLVENGGTLVKLKAFRSARQAATYLESIPTPGQSADDRRIR